jgi:hypothetical protein
MAGRVSRPGDDKKLCPKSKDAVHIVSFCIGLVAWEETVELEVVFSILHSQLP